MNVEVPNIHPTLHYLINHARALSKSKATLRKLIFRPDIPSDPVPAVSFQVPVPTARFPAETNLRQRDITSDVDSDTESGEISDVDMELGEIKEQSTKGGTCPYCASLPIKERCFQTVKVSRVKDIKTVLRAILTFAEPGNVYTGVTLLVNLLHEKY
jgi:hypothetical protein